MSRSSGTYTAPSSTFNPAVEGTTIDEGDWNTLLDDIEAALTESAYTSGMGSTDNQLVRTDGTDTKKVQGTGITVDDSNNMSGVAALTATTVNVGNSDTTLARSGAGDLTVEGNAIYRAGGTDIPIADGGTGASTAITAFNALSPLTTQGDILYHNGTNNVRLAPGTVNHVLKSGGAGANPSWGAAGAGDLVAANNLSDVASAATAATNLGLGTGSSPQFTAVNIGHASDTSITRTGAGDIAVEGNAIYRAGGTDIAIADGGTGASTAAAGFRALAEGVGSTQGDLLYRSGTQWSALGTGTVGQVLQAGGAGANPSWATIAGTGDVTAASNITDNRIVRGDGGAKGVQQSAITIDDSGNMTGVGTVNGATVGSLSAPQGRLTLTTATPVLTSSVSGSTTVYYTPYNGRYVPLYDGVAWSMTDIGAELSQATTDSTKSPAACTTNSNYDLFVWSDGGTYRCTRGPAWTSDTARGTGADTTELERIIGVFTNKVAITNGPGANRGTYVGTIRTNGSSQVDFIFGAKSAGGTPAVFGVWNMYNRNLFATTISDTTDFWTYASATFRAVNNTSNMRVSYICGLAEDAVDVSYISWMGSTATDTGVVALGVDSTSTATGIVVASTYTATTISQFVPARLAGMMQLGWHYIQALEASNNGNTIPFYGDAGQIMQSGMAAFIKV